MIDAHLAGLDRPVLARIRAPGTGDRLPVIAMTQGGVAPALALTAPELLQPIEPGSLHHALHEVLDGRRARQPARGTAPESVAQGARPTSAAAERRALRILVAEDNLVNQKLMRLLLGRLGYRPDVVANGREAVEAVQRQHYDVVLMDLHMPEMDGMQATSYIRAQLDARAQPRIIAVTADALDETHARCMAVGMDACLIKPVVVADLTAVLHQE